MSPIEQKIFDAVVIAMNGHFPKPEETAGEVAMRVVKAWRMLATPTPAPSSGETTEP